MNPASAVHAGLLAFLAALLLATGQAAASSEAAWQALKAGGHVVLMRHAHLKSGPGQGDSLTRDPSCAKERKLSRLGKQVATRTGEAFKSRGIAVGEVLASPYCRTTDTARMAFGSSAPAGFLSLAEVLPPAEAASQAAEAIQHIGSHQGPANLVMVTHEPNIAAITFELAELGAFFVLKPRGGSDFDIVGKIKPDTDSLPGD